jgi:hypothetical protein
MGVSARKSPARSRMKMNRAAIADVVEVLARHNPTLSKTALAATGKVFAVVSAAAARLSADQQRRIVADEEMLEHAVEAAVSGFATEPRSKLISVRVKKPVEISQGAGLGRTVDLEEGRRRLAAYATPCRLEDWAGAVAGPGEIEKALGTSRSTLHDWQRRGAVIGLLKGKRKHVFPLAQFVDGRPVEGMVQVTQIIRNPRVAWQWLIEPRESIGGSPLEALKAGRLNEVVAAAKRDFA